MSEVIQLLELEHQRIASVLGVLDDQLRLLETHAEPNDALLQLALDYLAGFPDACHHPKEDLVFHRLKDRAPELARSVADLLGSHEGLSRLTRRLCEEAREDSGSTGARTSFASSLRLFLGGYREHMKVEERQFFPAARNGLSREDFAILDFQVFDQSDPLVGEDTEERFQALRKEIARLARRGGSERREARPSLSDTVGKLLHSVTSVDEFNSALEGEGLFLVRHEGRGYELTLGDRWLVDIEDCTESRAIWVAYYFLKGIERQQQLDPRSR